VGVGVGDPGKGGINCQRVLPLPKNICCSITHPKLSIILSRKQVSLDNSLGTENWKGGGIVTPDNGGIW